MIAIHLTARAHPGLTPLSSHSHCVDLWESLRADFPNAIACALMPNHVHLLIPATRAPESAILKRRFAICLRAFARRSHKRSLWQAVPNPQAIPDLLHLKRQIRYVHRNPCRARLTSDPVTWPWTTHRDVLGMVWPAWVTRNRIAGILGESTRGFRERFHHYVSADQPTPRGTPMITEESHLIDDAGPERLRDAVQSAIRNEKCRAQLLAAILRTQPGSAQRLRSQARILRIPASTLSRQGRAGLTILSPEARSAVALTLRESALQIGTPRTTLRH